MLGKQLSVVLVLYFNNVDPISITMTRCRQMAHKRLRSIVADA